MAATASAAVQAIAAFLLFLVFITASFAVLCVRRNGNACAV
jgi:hypothetical protein